MKTKLAYIVPGLLLGFGLTIKAQVNRPGKCILFSDVQEYGFVINSDSTINGIIEIKNTCDYPIKLDEIMGNATYTTVNEFYKTGCISSLMPGKSVFAVYSSDYLKRMPANRAIKFINADKSDSLNANQITLQYCDSSSPALKMLFHIIRWNIHNTSLSVIKNDPAWNSKINNIRLPAKKAMTVVDVGILQNEKIALPNGKIHYNCFLKIKNNGSYPVFLNDINPEQGDWKFNSPVGNKLLLEPGRCILIRCSASFKDEATALNSTCSLTCYFSCHKKKRAMHFNIDTTSFLNKT